MVVMTAPFFIRLLVPSAPGDATSPGNANTCRPWYMAWRAVIKAPLFISASTTTHPAESPLIMRFLTGKWCFSGRLPGGYSEIIAPRLSMVLYRFSWSRGYMTSAPPPRTAMVLPPALIAPQRAIPSTPSAIPLTTTAPPAASP